MLYEYKCNKCEHITEIIRKVDERDEPAECEECGHEYTQRCYTVVPFHLKGTGWYSDGYQKKDK